jgi:glycosyltransferase involved in cell wall biosynthesis
MNPTGGVRLPRSLLFAASGLVQTGMNVARRLLPRSVRRRLVGAARMAESALATSTGWRFERRPVALADCRPILSATDFASGPIVLANNALAAGGVERQVVNTLLGLERQDLAAGLLCLRLHEAPEFDFFLPALTGYSGFVRNIMPIGQARAKVASLASGTPVARMRAAVSWMPQDVQDDVFRFAAEFADLRPSVVHAWQDSTNIAAAYGAWLIGVPRILVSSRNVAPINFAYFRPYMLHAYREIATCPSITMINNSEAGAHDYARWIETRPDRFVVKRNGIDTRAMNRPSPQATADLRARLGIPAGAKVVGSIFRFYVEKRPLLWIETAARISKQCAHCHFVIFGEGPMQREVFAAARRHGIEDRLHCPGNIADPALGLSLFDVFLLTSKYEGTPNVVLEASILGIPVVTTDAGGAREAVAEGVTGRVAATLDADEIARHVLAILNDPAWCARVATEGPAFVEQRFGVARMLEETLALYRQQQGTNAHPDGRAPCSTSRN